MARKIVVTSGKGGVGKTTVCCNLGVQLARKGFRVAVCDLDFGLNNVDVVLGVENMALYDIVDVIEGRCRARQALTSHPRYPTLFSLASNKIAERYVSPQAIRLVLETLSPRFDFLLIDSPAGIDDGFHRAASCADEALLVTTPHISAMRDADRVATILRSYRFREISLCVNLVRRDMARKGEILSPEEIASALRIPVVAVIPEEDVYFLDNITDRSRAFKKLAEHYISGGEEEKRTMAFGRWKR